MGINHQVSKGQKDLQLSTRIRPSLRAVFDLDALSLKSMMALYRFGTMDST